MHTCVTVISSDSNDKCNMVIKFWYEINASDHNEEGSFVLFESTHIFFILEVFLNITPGTIYKEINLS